VIFKKLKELRKLGFLCTILLIFRRYIFQIIWMGEYGARYDELCKNKKNIDYKIEFLPPEKFHEVLTVNTYLKDSEIQLFKNAGAVCIIVKDNDEYVGNTWMIPGGQDFYYNDLGYTIHIESNDYYSLRTFVNSSYRGKRLFPTMVIEFAENNLVAKGKIWGHIYNWNTGSVKAVEHIGWTRQKNIGFAKIIGIKFQLNRGPECNVGYVKDSVITSTGYIIKNNGNEDNSSSIKNKNNELNHSD
jgi:hypothetical protein